jgi:hypothetical protein
MREDTCLIVGDCSTQNLMIYRQAAEAKTKSQSAGKLYIDYDLLILLIFYGL